MRVQDAVPCMTTMYLRRILDSFLEDAPPKEEDEARSTIVRHTDDLGDAERIRRRLVETYRPYPKRLLERFVLEALLNDSDCTATEAEIHEHVVEYERKLLEETTGDDCFEYVEKRPVEILSEVLEVALDDGSLSPDEDALVERLRQHLGLSKRHLYLILGRLDHFPRRNNDTHTHSEVKSALSDLQYTGVVFHCNHHPDGPRYLIPDELTDGVKQAIDFELSRSLWRLLLNDLRKDQLQRILADGGAPVSGRKDELIERVLQLPVAPSEALELFRGEELRDLLEGLPGVNISGSKAEKIDRVIYYFANRTVHPVAEDADPREAYYEYLVELARRDRANLYANDVVSKDIDIERAFEEGTRYLFEEHLGQDLIETSGSDHADGGMVFEKTGEILLWDNKSKESVYSFPNSHVRQFARYIREADSRVSCFLIIVPSVGDGIEQNVYRLKADSADDTDVAVVTAEDLRWVAESWPDYGDEFDPQVFNLTGVLDRQLLEQRLASLLD